MTVISSAKLVAKGKRLLEQATAIPYVLGGMTLEGMDCQGLVEYLLIQSGVPPKECNLAGSNARFRACKWLGTPEEAVALFGAVPEGAALFIWVEDGAPSKYDGDGMGNAEHMGVYLEGETAIHASASRGCVAESVFKQKTIPNGGWNRVGLQPWVHYGEEVEAILESLGAMAVDEPGTIAKPVQPATPEPSRYFAKVVTPNGGPVKMREKPSKTCELWKHVPNGETVLVIGTVVKGGTVWCKVERNSRKWYIMADFLQKM